MEAERDQECGDEIVSESETPDGAPG